jgi:N-acetylglucosaminyldiphosphoundecaprenol N-acetyl-beta-D-mannosaminyltransferase
MDSKIVMGVRVDNLPLAEALNKAREFLRSGNKHKIFTPNPEMLVKAVKDEYFRQVLNAGDLNLCDGFWLWLALKISPDCHSEHSEESYNIKKSKDPSPRLASGLRMTEKAERIAGVDFMIKLCQLAAERGSSVYLLGSGSDNVVRKTADELSKQFPCLKIAGYNKGPMIDETMITDESVDNIRRANPDILFVAFGMGKQEKWIHENLAKLPSVKIAMGVGGAFDYISGAVKRAPCWMRQIGLEWMYRLIKQPKRFKRIFNATVIFCILLLFKHENIKSK